MSTAAAAPPRFKVVSDAAEFNAPPRNLEAEARSLGACLISAEAMHDVFARVAPEDFYAPELRDMAAGIKALYDAGRPVDPVTLADELGRRGHLESVGDLVGIMRVVDGTAHAANAAYHAQIVKEQSLARRILEACQESQRDAFSGRHTADELLERFERRMFDVAGRSNMGARAHRAADVVPGVLAALDARLAGEVHGLETGLGTLDRLLNNLQPTSVYVVAGRTSMGKTAIVLNVCEHVAVDQGRPVLYVSLEMGRAQLLERMIATRAGVAGDDIRKALPLLSRPDDMARVVAAAEEVAAAPLFVEDAPGLNATQVAAAARRAVARDGVQLVVVDYIQRVATTGEDGPNLAARMTMVSNRMKTMARELDVPVLLLSQLNRSVEGREDHVPRSSDLKESGAIEEDADAVLLLWRPEYYDPADRPGLAELIVSKNRHGDVGRLELAFDRRVTRFRPLDPTDPRDI